MFALSWFSAAVNYDVRLVGMRIQSWMDNLWLQFNAECLAAKLLHSTVVHHFHVFTTRSNARRAILKLLEVKHSHLLNVDESLVIRRNLRLFHLIWASASGRARLPITTTTLVMQAELVKLPLIEVSKVTDGAERGVGCLVLLHSGSLAILVLKMLLNVSEVDLLILEIVVHAKVLHVLAT